MTRWETGSAEVEALLAAGDLERVAASADNADRLLAEADRHPRSSQLLGRYDPAGAFDLLYAAARKAMAAALAAQGLRAIEGALQGARGRRPAQMARRPAGGTAPGLQRGLSRHRRREPVRADSQARPFG